MAHTVQLTGLLSRLLGWLSKFDWVLEQEQHNLINDTAQADRVATMRHTLSLEVGKFFSNRDKFVNDCPADLDPEKDLGCACWMAKHRYGGFMGPFAMLPPGYGIADEGNAVTATESTEQK